MLAIPNPPMEPNSQTRKLVLDNAPLDQLVVSYQSSPASFRSTVKQVLTSVEVPALTKARLLVFALLLKQRDFALELLGYGYELPEIEITVNILDALRLERQLVRQVEQLQRQTPLPEKAIKALNIRLATNVEFKLPEASKFQHVSLGKSKIKFLIRHWIRNIPVDRLEFFAFGMTGGHKRWKAVLDKLHPAPSDFKLPWFSQFIFTGEAPEDSFYAKFKASPKQAALHISTYRPEYKLIRLYTSQGLILTPEMKEAIVSYTPLDVLLWYWEELTCPSIGRWALKRLEEAEPTLPYGTLVDRLGLIRRSYASVDSPNYYLSHSLVPRLLSVADSRLLSFRLKLEEPVAVLADGSGSMEVAIKTSAIITSMLTAICRARLLIFRDKSTAVDIPPRTVADVLHFGEHCRAHGGTSPASAMADLLTIPEAPKTIIIVTDEEENVSWANQSFRQVFDTYYSTRYPARLVFVSFLAPGIDGQMFSEFKRSSPGLVAENKVLQFRFDRARPDLTKLDDLLGWLALL